MQRRLTVDDVRKVAALARLELDDEELRALRDELDQILRYVDKLAELDLEGVPPTTHVMDLVQPLRADTPIDPLPRRAVLAIAPEHDGASILVPKVIG